MSEGLDKTYDSIMVVLHRQIYDAMARTYGIRPTGVAVHPNYFRSIRLHLDDHKLMLVPSHKLEYGGNTGWFLLGYPLFTQPGIPDGELWLLYSGEEQKP